ncbi:neuronal acetylcholine receptor subunit alpha-7-like, partial [Sinocyclocheilus rhinocerous]|uniref:neuronal acetylcholine receptor subunit alpha-7-like n=1 Tax=Sinocyclocheilus rhinocerous TaxID=307959 RepID=UPI0007B80E3B
PAHHASASSIQMGVMPGQPPSANSTTNGHMNLYFGFNSIDSACCPPSSDSGVSCSGGRVGGSPNEEQQEAVRMFAGEQEIHRILVEVMYIAQRFRDQDEAEAICSEWKFAAAVVDRLCLVAFSLFSIICTFTILMSAPNFIEAVSKDFT